MSRPLTLLLASVFLIGCGSTDPSSSGKPKIDPKPSPVAHPLHGDLAADIREIAHVELSDWTPDFHATIRLTGGFGVAPAGAALSGEGHAEAFPEADLTLYTARFDAPADPTGPCGTKPVSLALSLERRAKSARVGGALTAYCGSSTWHGVPARVVRLSGDLPLP